MVGGEGIVFLSPPLFVFALCLVSFLGVGWVVLVGGGFVLGVVGVRGERGVSTGSGGVSCGCAIVLARIFFILSFHGNSPQPGLVEGFTVSGG